MPLPQVPADKALEAFKKIDTDNSGIVTFKVSHAQPRAQLYIALTQKTWTSQEFRDSMYEKKNMVRTTVDWTLKAVRHASYSMFA